MISPWARVCHANDFGMFDVNFSKPQIKFREEPELEMYGTERLSFHYCIVLQKS